MILLTRPLPHRILSLALPRLFTTQTVRKSTLPSPSAPSDPTTPKTLSGRLRHLINTYGWYALGLYAVIGVLDFGVAFALIQLLGAEKVSKLSHWLKESVLSMLGRSGQSKEVEATVRAVTGADAQDAAVIQEGIFAGHETLWAMIVLAYGIHKTIFLPVRVGLIAAITPRFVNWLRSKGWAGAAGTMRAAEAARSRMRGVKRDA